MVVPSGDQIGRAIAARVDAMVTGMSVRSRVLDWAVAIIVAVGVVASIPMIPLVAVGWLVLSARSPLLGRTAVTATREAADDASSGKLQGFNGALLFPMVVAGWFLIALLVFGLTVGDEDHRSGGSTALGLALFLVILVVPTFLCYRSMNPKIAEVPLTEWLGSRNFGQVGIPLVTWAACVWLVWSITTWTTVIGTTWTTICAFVLVVTVLVAPRCLRAGEAPGRPASVRVHRRGERHRTGDGRGVPGRAHALALVALRLT